MATSLVSTGVQFPDSTIQTTAAAGGGSAWEYLSVATGTSASSFTFTSGFNSSNYIAYAIEFDRVYINGSTGTLNVTLAYSGGSLATSGYLWGNGLMAGSASSVAWLESSGNNIPIGSLNFGSYFQGSNDRAANGFLYIYNGGQQYPLINWFITVNRYYTLIGGGQNTTFTGTPTSINLAPSVGTLNGTLRFYGLRNS